jgi:hypothetical protein
LNLMPGGAAPINWGRRLADATIGSVTGGQRLV